MLGVWATMTGRGRATAALGLGLLVAGALWRYPVLAGLGGCLVALVIGDLVVVLRASQVQARRAVAPYVVVRNDPCQGTLHLSSRRAGALAKVEAFDLVDGSPVPVPFDGASRALAASLTYPIATPRRGLMTVGPVQLHRRGVAGMAARTDETGGRDEVRVLPRRVPVSAIPRGRRRAHTGGDDSAELGGTDLVGLHEYTMGDDLRRLHWATSARTGTLMVREDAEPAEAHVLVLIDDRAASYGPPPTSFELFEEAVELTAALCQASIDTGGPLRFASLTGRHQIVIPGTAALRPRHEARELEWLLAEIQLDESADLGAVTGRDLDVAVVVTGPYADRTRLAHTVFDAPTRVIAVVDAHPTVGATDEAGALVIRGATATELAQLWDAGVAR